MVWLVSSFMSGLAAAMTETTTLSPSIFAFGALSVLLWFPPEEQPAASNAAAATTAAILFPGECGFMALFLFLISFTP
ncbi:hypothetical protein GCM10009733_108010 [Nonomuraea maheshkhaliensis]|uniref:Secreted protein n=1 Tax=Nonomuraea maheshkhaliensis TaxID=419590 RepID=A0ABP4TVI8_9ACTN